MKKVIIIIIIIKDVADDDTNVDAVCQGARKHGMICTWIYSWIFQMA
jgi:hypothetical protein